MRNALIFSRPQTRQHHDDGEFDMSAQPAEKSKWTILIYFAADNDLDEAAFKVLREIKKVGSNSDLNIIAQLDTRGIGRTFRFRLRDDRYTIEEDRIWQDEEINTGDPKELTKFITWGVEKFPADHYMLVIWGHGQGWELARDDHSPARAGARTVGAFQKQKSRKLGSDADITESSEDVLNSCELDQALRESIEKLVEMNLLVDDKPEGKPAKIDILGMDACMMGTTEVAHHLRDRAKYMIASEDTVPLDSWPYARIFDAMRKSPAMTPEDLSTSIIREYLIQYRDQVKGATLATFNLEASITDKLTEALTMLARELKTRLSQDPVVRFAVMKARIAAQTFYLKEFVDLYDFCDQLSSIIEDAEIEAACNAVKAAIHDQKAEDADRSSERTLVREQGFYGYQMNGAKGASIYFPWNWVERKDYCQLPLVEKTGWGRFLEEFSKGPELARERSSTEEKGARLKKEEKKTPLSPLFVGLQSNIKILEGTTEKITEGTREKGWRSFGRIPSLRPNDPKSERQEKPSAPPTFEVTMESSIDENSASSNNAPATQRPLKQT
ncbi:MAG: clostripain-related cysteine peptidase [Blastocatellia bacterium]|nr:clostripain-related cysteine peptidase [Blastocatellia bacterium]